ncbi:MAG: hypothetical protein U5K69_16465 [Balneolaceae bacterium]|nr:hypothetical protein [Balneolaceae bacterium]
MAVSKKTKKFHLTGPLRPRNSERRAAGQQEFGIPAGSTEASSKREGPLANSDRTLVAGFSIPQP